MEVSNTFPDAFVPSNNNTYKKDALLFFFFFLVVVGRGYCKVP